MNIKEKLQTVADKLKKEAKVISGEETKNTSFSSKRKFSKIENISKGFERAKEKLFDVNRWSDIPELINSGFQLHTPDGQKTDRKKPIVGDYISIDIPGPFPLNWVRVIYVEESINSAEFIVTPSEDPSKKGEPEVVQHFFTDDATSTFKVEVKGNTLYAYEFGRNEAVNSQGPEAGDRSLINAVIAEGGWAAVQKIQWKNLTDYLVDV